MESRSSARGGDHGHRHRLDHHQQLLLRPAGGGGMSWPTQRSSSSSYTCVYCKREFRSTQALAGHMSGHRRERARLRYYCSNPAAATHRDRVPNLNFSPSHCTDGDYGDSASTTTMTTPAVYSYFSTAAVEAVAAKAALVVDMEVGVGGGLDLELRLGCS